MNLEVIRAIPFLEKKLLVAEACLMFNKLNETIKIVESRRTTLELSDSGILQKRDNLKSVSIFNTIFALLEPRLSQIIKNDFIEGLDPGWYRTIFSKTSYYKLKHQAIDQFLYLLYA